MEEFEYSGKAMGTNYSVAVVCDSEAVATEAWHIAKAEVEAYDAKFSRFAPTSEISLLNKRKDMRISETFLKVTAEAQKLFFETRGVFNPLVQISRFGYDRDFSELEDAGTAIDEDERYDIDFSTTLIDPRASRIRLNEGQELDYGGFLKGYLAELIARKIEERFPAISGIVVNLGGDIHARGLDRDRQEFQFHIYNPILDNEDIVVNLRDQSLATSGTYKRFWRRAGRNMHHILDVSGTDNPTSEIVSASVVCENGGKAEAYAKVFLSLGTENAVDLLKNESISFLSIDRRGKVVGNIIKNGS